MVDKDHLQGKSVIVKIDGIGNQFFLGKLAWQCWAGSAAGGFWAGLRKRSGLEELEASVR